MCTNEKWAFEDYKNSKIEAAKVKLYSKHIINQSLLTKSRILHALEMEGQPHHMKFMPHHMDFS